MKPLSAYCKLYGICIRVDFRRRWDISGPCGKFFKLCDQQCVGRPPWSIRTYRLCVWQEWSWEPLCLNPWQTVLGNHKIKGEHLIPKAALGTFLALLWGLKHPHHNWATRDSKKKCLWLCFIIDFCCQLIILFLLIQTSWHLVFGSDSNLLAGYCIYFLESSDNKKKTLSED